MLTNAAAIALHAHGIEKPSHMTVTLPENIFVQGNDESELCEYCANEYNGFLTELNAFL